MSLQKYLLSLERKRSKNKDEAYWEAREQSIDDANRWHDRLRLFVLLFIGFAIMSKPSYDIYKQSYMTEVVVPVYDIKTYEKQTRQGLRDVTVYIFRYSLGGHVYEGSKGIYGSLGYRRGQEVSLLVDPSDPTKPILNTSEEENLIVFSIGALVTLLSSFFLFIKGRRQAELARNSDKRQSNSYKRRGL